MAFSKNFMIEKPSKYGYATLALQETCYFVLIGVNFARYIRLLVPSFLYRTRGQWPYGGAGSQGNEK